MVVVGLEEVTHISDFVVRYSHKVPVWVRHVVEIVISINHEGFIYFIESMCGDIGQ